jgi:type II secretion system protein G
MKLGGVTQADSDGVLIYFGYPAAHEDDAERAVWSGLALIAAVATLPAPEPLHVRIRVATGIVVVGDLVGSGEGQEHDVVGETPNLAARLQGIGAARAELLSESKVKAAKIQMQSFASALDLFHLDAGRYPSTSEGLAALVRRTPGVAGWNGPYLRGGNVPNDPWNNPYIYRAPGEHGAFDIVSLGSDGQEVNSSHS